ncbi:hypothetical protein pETSU_264 [Edwardsiella phage pEt-SU]|uniref:Uncharacterized protein n=1 Tax=Edwardsiella phage pEt-SU TaxID=2562142 RepID=A0A4D6DX10_9CAUD|nr:hypothetical protein HOV39_gp258 [Edwardsiella phage pEt-SU]QBZ70845.1 hypothetical protein pETSU_264 [Edwardsiella phage pEt-SU]
MLINNETVSVLSDTLKERLKEMLEKEEMQVYHATTKHDIPFRITIHSNPAAKINKVEVDICAQTRLTGNIPFNSSKAKTTRSIQLALLFSQIPKVAENLVFDIVAQSIREGDVLADVLNGLTNEVKVVTPLGIDVYCHTDTDHRVFQITKAGKQVYAFEEALNLVDGGDIEMMRPTKDLIEMTSTILRKAFTEGDFTPFETEVLL